MSSGRVELSGIRREELPEPMQVMSPAEQERLISETAEWREELKKRIADLSRQRADFLEQKVDAAGGADDSLDDRIYRAVREQAGKLGISYEADAPAY